MPPYRAVLFDLDGTLVDSQRDINDAMVAALAEMGIAVSIQDLGPLRGAHLSLVYAHLLGKPAALIPADETARVISAYRRHYMKGMLDHTTLFPEVARTLDRLGFMRKAISTSKPMEYAQRLVDHFNLNFYFEAVVGCENIPPKPNPAVFEKTARMLGVPIAECLVVGDTDLDLIAGKKAGCATCLIDYDGRYGPQRENADFVVRDFLSVEGIIAGNATA